MAPLCQDVFRRFRASRKKPVEDTPAYKKASSPAQVFICDNFGKHEARGPRGEHFDYPVVDQYTGYVYLESRPTHTENDWIEVMRSVKLDAESLGHKVETFRFDRAGELRTQGFKARAEKELGVRVELAPRTHPEGIADAEGVNGILTPMAEADLQRAQLGTSFLLPARRYAAWRHNRMPSATNKMTRHQMYRKAAPSVDGHLVPYLFGTTCLVHNPPEHRGPKGSLDKPRALEGRILGIDDRASNYIVLKKGGGIIHPKHVDPLDELQLQRRGMPTSAAAVDAETQTEAIEAIAPLARLTTTAKAPKPPPLPIIELPVGTRVRVWWTPPSGGAKQPYEGSITEVIGSGRRAIASVTYDGWPEIYPHNFTTTKRKWETIRLPSAAPDHEEQPGPRRSARNVRLTAAVAHTDAMLESTRECAQGEMFNAALFAILGAEGAEYECGTERSLEASRMRLLIDANGIGKGDIKEREALKAAHKIVDIETPIGTVQYKVPSNKKEVFESEHRDKWLEAERKALEVILACPGNRLVPITVPGASGTPIGRCVTQRSIKVDQATGVLDRFKSRHCVDGGFLAVQQKQAAERNGTTYEPVVASSTVAEESCCKCMLSHAACKDLDLTKGDVGDAYLNGTRLREVGYMEMPATIQEYAEDGTKLCIECGTPVWGDAPSGYEWQLTFNATLAEIGWQQCEAVPAMWVIKTPEGRANLVTIVDDFLISETKESGRSIANRTITALTEKFGKVTSEHEPTAFAGYKIQRDRARRALTISMPQKIVEAVREHLPELLDGVRPELPSNKKLSAMADQLELAPPHPSGKRSKQQVATQRIIGSLKFVEKVMPKLSMPLHRLSCVMSNSTPEAYVVARAVLADAYSNRECGITYGGEGPDSSTRFDGRMAASVKLAEPAGELLEAAADATWGDRLIYGLILSYGRGAVLHITKKIGLLLDSSMESEAVASAKAAESVTYIREVLRALGDLPDGPTPILTDNQANLMVAKDAASASRARHFLRRYTVLQQRVAAHEVSMYKIDDPNQPADFLTKWLSGEKLAKSIDYATNASNRVGR